MGGNEIIAVSYPNPDRLEGLKLTGDPNVPVGKVSFHADLNKSIIMSIEAQKGASCNDLIHGIEELSQQVLNKQDSSQPFILPNDAEVRVDCDVEMKRCTHRFLGEAQIAL